MSALFQFDVRVYYEDTDAAGIVYYANYFRFLERGRTEFLRTMGHDQHALMQEGIAFAVRSVSAEFLKPADSPRDPSQGAPATVFRYDLTWEFISAIVEGRDAVPSFADGLNAQVVADSVLESHAKRADERLELEDLRRATKVIARTLVDLLV